MDDKQKQMIAIIIMIMVIVISPFACAATYRVGYYDGIKSAKTGSIEESTRHGHNETKLHGVDISAWQAENYKGIIERPDCDFVICRATESTYVDPVCDLAYQYAKSKGKLLGVYFFADPKIHDAADYAKFCADTVEGYVGETVFILDCEVDPSTDWILEWLQEFERITGTKPLVYTNLNTAETLNWEGVINNGNKLWLAYYGYDDGSCYEIPDQVGAWPKEQIAMHQYTTSGLGERETLDLDIFFGNEEDWEALTRIS